MAEPFGVPAGRVSSDVPGVIPGGPRPLPPSTDGSAPPTEPGTGEPLASHPDDDGEDVGEDEQPSTVAQSKDETDDEDGADEDAGEESAAAAVQIGDDEEIIDLTEEDREAIPTRSDDTQATRGWD
jgi:hypothetical protein